MSGAETVGGALRSILDGVDRLDRRIDSEARAGADRLWRVTGNDRHQVSRTIKIRAEDHNEAVRKASQSPNMLIVRECVLVDGSR